MKKSNIKILALSTAIAALVSAGQSSAQTVNLNQAIEAALESNPEINQAIQNKEAIEF